MPLAPDVRWSSICGGITSIGQVRAMSVEVLEEVAHSWAAIVDDVEPFGGAELLENARSLVVQSWFDYELLVTASLVALQAVEATFRQILFPDAKPRVSFRQLVDRAAREGVFPPEKAELIRAGVELRNGLSHPAGRAAFSMGMAGSIIRVSHLVVRDVCGQRGMIRPVAGTTRQHDA